VRYKSAEEGAKPEETYVPSTEDTEQCSLVLEVSPERDHPSEKEILNSDIHLVILYYFIKWNTKQRASMYVKI
jgi:hypothetical protein